MILTLRTDKPESEIGLFDGESKIAYQSWQAHRRLAETILKKINQLLDENNLALEDLDGFVVFEGPGSFTGLRIGISVANALAYGLGKPVVASGGEDWILKGFKKLAGGKGQAFAVPVYGSAPNITKQKK